MVLSYIFNNINHISESIGLPPIVLICTIGLFFFIFIFGLLILIKVRSIRKDLILVNRSLDTLNQRIQEEMARLKTEKLNRNKDNESSNRIFPKIDVQNRNQIKNSSDYRRNDILGSRGKKSNIRSKVLKLLKKTSRPISYYEIAKNISKNSPDYDFESILKELDQLKQEGEVIGQVSAGKLYFQIKK